MSVVNQDNVRDRQDLLDKAEKFVKDHMAGYDPSHDWHHVQRVRKLAIRIAKTLDPLPDLLVVELTALFHDLDDHKYRTESSPTLSELLNPLLNHKALNSEQSNLIIKIIPNISYTTEIKLQKLNQWNWQLNINELKVVQDSDRLDAIGSIGILRLAAYSCKINRKLINEDQNNINNNNNNNNEQKIGQSAEDHFEEKLLKVKDRMKTPFGKLEAERRHKTMIDFLTSLEREREILYEDE
ncbi:uncharacterized protein I206_102263 [Kwoniella pini CBS 10737]|uniref:HD/PDEase domain-containing protein n=1 Tax=Kwoniella pini CBS 10737 TaxID=1296096 RepID=A0A1B9HT01_9TREE|nr:uncharacterized protein I206_07633 [Kwoniella pini CBS 10737]OCF46399.1 hypothetical protein I206_07633 [Kwoniella pini CBS 10737]